MADEEAAEPVFDRTPQDCVQLSRVSRTHVLDDQTIVFYLRGKKALRNYLPRKCPGLERSDRFMYETRSGRLCSVDTITVLEQWGARLQPGFRCQLGEFHPLSPEEIEDLKVRKKDDVRERDAIQAEPVELPPAEDSSDESAAPEAVPRDN